MSFDKSGKQMIRKPESTEQLSFLFAGDFCPRGPVPEKLLAEGKGASIMEPLQSVLRSADVSFIQFETPLTNADTPICKSGPNLKCSPESIEIMHSWGGDVALLANNHTGDYGPEPVIETIEILQKHGFQTVGAGKDLKAAQEPLVFTKHGFKIGVINIAENEFGGALRDQAGANPLSPFYNLRQIKELSPKVDTCVVVIHGGNETNPVPSPRVVNMCRAFVDAGADIVINIHTHCPQGIETWNGKPIVYSLGNFYFPNVWTDTYDPKSFWYTGYMVRFQVDRKGAFSIEAIPIHFGLEATRVELLEGEEKKGFLEHLAKISEPLSDWDEIMRFHEAWAAGPGNYVAKFIATANWSLEDFDNPEKKKALMPLRNIFTCEAHCELVGTWLKLFEQGRLKQAAEFYPQLQTLREATFIKH